jgi:4-amino-4-deoxy-L-arabinose transferase-like glycosyltransferase
MRAVKYIHWIDILVLLLSLIVTLVGIGSYGLYEPHEGHFAMVGREMIWRNDWITPHLNGSPYLNKPPLLYWLIATSTKIFGANEFSARLPVALTGWLGIIVAWKWTRQLWGINSSRICALMLSVTLGWFIFTHQILIDVVLGTLLLCSNYFLWRLLVKPRSLINWWGAYLSLALCVLTKGLIGIVFPLIGCLALTTVRRDWKIIRRIKLFRGLLLVLILVLPWFLAVEHNNPGFWHYFVVNEHLDRIFDRRFPPDYEVSKIGALGYLAVTAAWCFPWILFLPSVIKSTWKEWQAGIGDRGSLLDRHHSDGIFLLAVAAMLPVVLFLPLSSRLIYYSIPTIPPYIILCAGWWSKKNCSVRQYTTTISYPVATANYCAGRGTLCKSLVEIVNHSIPLQFISLYGAIALALGLGFYASIWLVPLIIGWLPAILQTSEIIKLMVIVAIALGTGWIASGIAMLRRSSLAWIPLFVALTITYTATIEGFILYQDIRSSKNLVQGASVCLSNDTFWIFEGSREIGAAGAIGYYLNQQPMVNSPQYKLGWAIANNRAYRTVNILADGGKNRIPPRFPGSSPSYLITKAQLQTYWDSDRPTAFLTDFMRQSNDSNDPITLNLPQGVTKPYLVLGSRQLYLNQAAQKLVRECY